VSALVGAIRDFLDHRTRHEVMAKAGRQKMMARFDHKDRVARLKNVYDEVLVGMRR
jgi:hypothetical protein